MIRIDRMPSLKTSLIFSAIVLALLLAAMLLLLWPRPMQGKFELRVAGLQRTNSSALLVTVVLSNGTDRVLNVVDDSAGNPAFVLDTGAEFGTWLAQLANRVRIHLGPGGCLTNAVVVSNPPPRFRLKVPLRDLASERRDGLFDLVLPRPVASKLAEWRRMPPPAPSVSEWIEPNSVER